MAKRVFTKVNLGIYFIFLLAFAIISVGAAIGVYNYFGHSLPSNDVTQKLEDKLTYGSSVTVDEVLKDEACDYDWITADDVIIEVFSTNNKGESELTQEVLEYSKEDGMFKVVGVASGMIKFTSGFDDTVNFTVTFTTKFKSSDTKELLESNYSNFAEDGIFTKTELSQVETIIISNKPSVDLMDFELLTNLKRLEIVQIPNGKLISITNFNIPSSTNIYVEAKQYLKYVNSKESIWRNNADRIFPTVINLNAHSVVLYKNEGVFANDNGDSIATFEVEDGNTFDLSTFFAIEKQGYQFLGWYTEDGKKQVDDSHVFNSDIKLYAKWEANTYTIRLHSNDATGRYVDNQFEYDEKKRIDNGSFIYDGFTQIGWAYEANATEVVFSPNSLVVNLTDVNGAIIDVYAIWLYDNFTIEFYNWGEQKEIVKYGESKQGQINQSFTLDVNLGSPNSVYGEFVGWAFEPEAPKAEYEYGAEVPFSAVQEMLTQKSGGVLRFYALYMLTSYNLTYNANGGDGSGLENLKTLPRGELLTISKPIEKEGHKFKGWLDNAGHLWVGEELYAKDEDYYASYDNNNLLQVIAESEEGWITLHGMEFVHAEEVVLTAVWKANTFNVVFEGNRTDSRYYNPATVTYGADYKFSGDMLKVGHERTACVSNYGNVSMPDRTLTAEQVITIYNALRGSTLNNEFDCSQTVIFNVSWSALHYTITFNYDGGTGSVKSVEIYYGNPYGPLPTPTRSRKKNCDQNDHCYTTYTFTGWKYGTKDVTSTSVMNVASDHTLVASWSSTTVTKDHCIASGTLVKMADGSNKKVEELSVGDKVLAWDFISQKYLATPITLLVDHGVNYYNILTLTFKNGSSVRIIGDHVFFDATLKEYVTINTENYMDYIGHKFMAYEDNGSYLLAELTAGSLSCEKTSAYAIVTAYYFNAVTENIISCTPTIPIYELISSYVKDDLTFDTEQFEKDVANTTLYDYSLFEEYLSYEQFDQLWAPYFALAEAKGFTTFEEIYTLMVMFSYVYD